MRYEIKGDTLPVVICYLEAGERMITERGSMAWMSPNMKMETSTNGGFGKAFGRMFSGDLFVCATIKANISHTAIKSTIHTAVVKILFSVSFP